MPCDVALAEIELGRQRGPNLISAVTERSRVARGPREAHPEHATEHGPALDHEAIVAHGDVLYATHSASLHAGEDRTVLMAPRLQRVAVVPVGVTLA